MRRKFALLLLLSMTLSASACSRQPSASPAERSIVCVDIHTGQVFAVDATESVPTVNPESGEKSLMPGLYCERCQTWHVAPSVEQLHRQHGVAYCAKTGGVLKLDGPRPDPAP
ncbi:MAG: hypothetical protein KDA75_18320 [Planctomycetaceae bacterium]|nr:hypothetical protein [Planctomycetaceae bacterium]